MKYSELSDQELFDKKSNNNDDIFPNKRDEIIKEVDKRIKEKTFQDISLFQIHLENDINYELENHVASLFTAFIIISFTLIIFALIYSNYGIFYDVLAFSIFLPIALVIKKTHSILAIVFSLVTGLLLLVLLFISEGNIMFMILITFVIGSASKSIFKILKYKSMIKSWSI